MSHHSDLIDTTEMYLRTVYELEEEGIVPLRARIAERLHQSGPTVSQTVARMERDGLLKSGWEDADVARADGRPPRRNYRVTREGLRAMNDALAQVHALKPIRNKTGS